MAYVNTRMTDGGSTVKKPAVTAAAARQQVTGVKATAPGTPVQTTGKEPITSAPTAASSLTGGKVISPTAPSIIAQPAANTYTPTASTPAKAVSTPYVPTPAPKKTTPSTPRVPEAPATLPQNQPTQPQVPSAPTAPPANPQADMESSANNVGSIMDSVGSIGREFASQSNEHAAAVAAQYSQMVTMLDALEAQITGQIRSQMNGDDPGMQAAIGIIREEAMRMRDESLADLNARGLVQSGIYAEMMTRLSNNELTQVQQAVAGRFGDLQNQLNNAVMSMAQARIGALSGNQSQMNSMLMNDRNTQATLGMQGATLGLQEQGQNLQNSQYYAGLGQQMDIAQLNDKTQRYGIDVGSETSRYGADLGYNASIYGADASKSNALLGYNASIYGSNVSRNNAKDSIAAQQGGVDDQGRSLGQQQFDFTVAQTNRANLQESMAVARQQLPGVVKAVKDGQYTLEEAFRAIDNANYEPQAAKFMKEQLEMSIPKQSFTPRPNNTYTPIGSVSGGRTRGY